MRPSQSTLAATDVQRLLADWLGPVLGPWPAARRATFAAVTAVLAYAAHRLASVSDACARLAAAPDGDTVLGLLARLLPDPAPLERRLQELRSRPDPSLLLGVDRALARGKEGQALEAHPQVVLFNGFPSARRLRDRLTRLIEEPESAEA